MLQISNTDTTAEFIFTLSELVTVDEPIYDFVFIHVVTKKEVRFSLGEGADNSEFPERYNSFTVDPALFDEPGEWHYTVYEQQTGIVLESGKLMVIREFNYTMYGGTTTYAAYNG